MKQKLDEFNQLLDIITNLGVTNMLEIGTYDGESAMAFSTVVHGTVLTVDPYARVKLPGNVKLISGFSQSPKTINQVAPYGPFKFIFVDGDHRRAAEDFAIYRHLMAPGGIMAFHDINPDCNFSTCPVIPVWDELKKEFSTYEIISKIDLRSGYGIGLVYL